MFLEPANISDKTSNDYINTENVTFNFIEKYLMKYSIIYF